MQIFISIGNGKIWSKDNWRWNLSISLPKNNQKQLEWVKIKKKSWLYTCIVYWNWSLRVLFPSILAKFDLKSNNGKYNILNCITFLLNQFQSFYCLLTYCSFLPESLCLLQYSLSPFVFLFDLLSFIATHCKKVLYKKELQQSWFYRNRAHSNCSFASLRWLRKMHV